MAQDLPAYLDLIKRSRPEEIVVISKELDPAYELTALVVKLEREGKRRPVLICERMKGTKFPVLTNLHASRSRLALAMGSAPDQMLATYLRAMDTPIIDHRGPEFQKLARRCLDGRQGIEQERDPRGPFLGRRVAYEGPDLGPPHPPGGQLA